MTQVRKLSVDDAVAKGFCKEQSTWDDVVAALKQLDGERWTQVGVLIDDEHYLIVGGGHQGYVLSYQRGDEVHSLIEGDAADDATRWVVCGQGADFPSDEVVGWDAVIAVAEVCFSSGARHPGFGWRAY